MRPCGAPLTITLWSMFASSSEVALLYNDKAVLENYHVSTSFRLLRDEDHNILSNLKREEYRWGRIFHNVFIHSFIDFFAHSFVHSFVWSSVRLFVGSFNHPYIRLFIHSSLFFVRSFVRSFFCSFFLFILCTIKIIFFQCETSNGKCHQLKWVLTTTLWLQSQQTKDVESMLA